MAKTSTDPHRQSRSIPTRSTACWRRQLCCLIFSLATILPTVAWADSFSIDIGTLCSFCTSGTLHVDHTIADRFFFSGLQTVTTLHTIGDPDFDGTLIYNVPNVPGGAPKIFSFAASTSGITGTFDFEIGKNGNPNEITFLETRTRAGIGESLTATQMGSLIFTHEGTTTFPSPVRSCYSEPV